MKHFLMLVAFFICDRLISQIITIRDNSTREAIPNVVITDKNKKAILSNNLGKADLSGLDQSEELKIYHPSFNQLNIKTEDLNEKKEIYLVAKLITLDEIVFSANRTREKKSDVPYQMEIIDQKQIEFGNQQNTGDVLANTGNVVLQKSQAGGGSPNIRGFEASRVLIVVDGIRMNNAIYRAGHLQDVMTLDAQMLDRTEVIFGPSSTIYGSDALGGVMHFYTKNAQFSSDENMLLKVNTMARYSSVNNEMTGHLDFNLGWKYFAALTNITWSRFGDTRSGTTKLAGYTNQWDRPFYVKRINGRDSMIVNADNNLLTGSGYEQTDMMQRFSFRHGAFTHSLNLQASINPNLPRFDRLANDYSGGKLKFAENYYMQNRMLGAYTLNFDETTAFSDNIRLILAYQKIDQDRITRNFQSSNRITQKEDLGVMSVNLDLMKKFLEKHELRYGIEVTANDVTSTANTLDIKKDSTFRANTRYAQDSKMNTYAAYLSHAFEVNKNFVISDGLRFTMTDLACTFTDTLPFKFPFKTATQKSQALTGSIGFTWKEENDYKFYVLANTGFRAPNVDDMSKLFDSKTVLIVANPNVKPEYASNFEVGLSKVLDSRLKFDISAYYTLVENYLTLQDFKFNGQDSVLFNGSMLKVQAMQNSDRAYIYGFNSGVQFDLSPQLSLKSTYNFVYGRYADVKNDTIFPQDHIPPGYGQSSVFFREKNIDAEFFARYSARKNLADYSPSGEDNLQYATPNGMPGWFTINLRLGFNLSRNLRLNAACENITDNRYRVFASGINAPGRNFIISLRYKL